MCQEKLVCCEAESASPSSSESPKVSEAVQCRVPLGLKEVGQRKSAAPAPAVQLHEQERVDEQHDACCCQPEQA